MQSKEIFTLGLCLTEPWKLKNQRLDIDKNPHELHLQIESKRGSRYPCPECGRPCKAHDFTELTWRHLNFFQHHCYLTASVPRTRCPDHGIKRIKVPWARKGSKFTLLFEQAAMMLVREMPVLSAARIMEITDTRLWRIVHFYVRREIEKLDLKDLAAFGLDETASKKGHNYVTVFIDLERDTRPVIFATPGKGKSVVKEFRHFMEDHGGDVGNIMEVVCDMSKAFLAATQEEFPCARQTVDWFHVVQLFTRAVDDVRRAESKEQKLPKATRWAVLKASDKKLTDAQIEAIAELEESNLNTAKAWRIREMLRWINGAYSLGAAKWRMGYFINYAKRLVKGNHLLLPVAKALETLERHKSQVLGRWRSLYTNARIEGFNSLFQAARSRARGYRNNYTFITIIYLIAAPLGDIVKST